MKKCCTNACSTFWAMSVRTNRAVLHFEEHRGKAGVQILSGEKCGVNHISKNKKVRKRACFQTFLLAEGYKKDIFALLC